MDKDEDTRMRWCREPRISPAEAREVEGLVRRLDSGETFNKDSYEVDLILDCIRALSREAKARGALRVIAEDLMGQGGGGEVIERIEEVLAAGRGAREMLAEVCAELGLTISEREARVALALRPDAAARRGTP